jgi:hypothetical protein
MLERLMSNGARTIIVESPDRFARDLMVQLAGHDLLKGKGISLVAASAPAHFIEDTPTAVLVRQVLGAIAEFGRQLLSASWRPHAGGSPWAGEALRVAFRPSRRLGRKVREPCAAYRENPVGARLWQVVHKMASMPFLSARANPARLALILQLSVELKETQCDNSS